MKIDLRHDSRRSTNGWPITVSISVEYCSPGSDGTHVPALGLVLLKEVVKEIEAQLKVLAKK